MSSFKDSVDRAKDKFQRGHYEDFLQTVADKRLDCFADPELGQQVVTAVDALVERRDVSYVIYLISKAKSWDQNPCPLLEHDSVIVTLAHAIAGSRLYMERDYISSMAKVWGGNEGFVENASAITAYFVDHRIKHRIEERKQEEQNGSFLMGDPVQTMIRCLVDFPALLKQSYQPIAHYLEFDLSRSLTLDGVKEELPELSEGFNSGAYLLATDDRSLPISEDEYACLRERLLDEAETPPFLKVIQSSPTLMCQIQTHCLMHPQDYPLAAARFGYAPHSRLTYDGP